MTYIDVGGASVSEGAYLEPINSDKILTNYRESGYDRLG